MAVRLLRGASLAAGLASTIYLREPLGSASPRPVSSSSRGPLAPTAHPPVAREASSLWLAPTGSDRTAASSDTALRNLQEGLKLYAQQRYEQAMARFMAAAAEIAIARLRQLLRGRVGAAAAALRGAAPVCRPEGRRWVHLAGGGSVKQRRLRAERLQC